MNRELVRPKVKTPDVRPNARLVTREDHTDMLGGYGVEPEFAKLRVPTSAHVFIPRPSARLATHGDQYVLLSTGAKPATMRVTSDSQHRLSREMAYFMRHYEFIRKHVPSVVSQKQEEVLSNLEAVDTLFKTARLITTTAVIDLIQQFIVVKQNHGSELERKFYGGMDVRRMINRIKHNRVMHLDGINFGVVNSSGIQSGSGGWELVGTYEESDGMKLRDFMSHHEMELSALCSVASESPFFGPCGNDRYKPAAFHGHGLFVGVVGQTISNKGGANECRMIFSYNNTTGRYERKYDEPREWEVAKLWARFYDHCANDDEMVIHANGCEMMKISPELFVDVYAIERRIKCSLIPFFQHATAKGTSLNRPVHCQITVMKLDIAMVLSELWYVYAQMIENIMEALDSRVIKVVECMRPGNVTLYKEINNIKFAHGPRYAEQVSEDHLLCAMYDHDPNTWPGNMYWTGSNKHTTQSAAYVSCSLIGFTQNTFFNAHLLNSDVVAYDMT